jgi:hypothetical protein
MNAGEAKRCAAPCISEKREKKSHVEINRSETASFLTASGDQGVFRGTEADFLQT